MAVVNVGFFHYTNMNKFLKDLRITGRILK